MGKSHRIKFDSTDLFLKDLRNRVLKNLKLNNDHIYGKLKDHLKLITYAVLAIFLYLFFLSTAAGWERYLLASLISALGILLVVSGAHDASHFRLFKTKKYNQWVMRPLFYIIGLDGFLWGQRHLRSHHPFTNIKGSDCDAVSTPLIRLSPHQPWMTHHRYQLFYTPFLYCFIFIQAVWIKDFHRIEEKEIHVMKGFKCNTRQKLLFYLTKLIHLCIWIIFPVIFTNNITFINHILTYFFAMATASILFILLAALNHYSEGIPFPEAKENRIDMPWSQHQIEVNVDWYSQNNTLTFLLGGANTHVAHHLMQDVHSRHLNTVTKHLIFILKDYPDYNYKNKTFFGALISHFKLIHSLSKKTEKANSGIIIHAQS